MHLRQQVKLHQIIILMALLLLMLFGSSTSYAGPPAQGRAPAIKLKRATFIPSRGERPTLPSRLTRSGYAEGETGYYIVQFRGPVRQIWKDRVTRQGAELLDYLPDFAFKARMTPAQARQVEGLNSVSWVGVFHPAYRLSPRLNRDGTNIYTVRLERGVDGGQVANAIAGSGAQVLQRQGNILLVAANSVQVDAIAQIGDVAWVENFALREKHNEYGAGVIMGANISNTSGYDGSSQTVAVADTGLGNGTASGAHPDILAGRISAIFDWTTGNVLSCYRIFSDGAQDVDSGHGTHVAVSVLGAGGPSGEAKGTAPAANLVFQSVEDYVDWRGFCSSFPDGYYLIGIPDNLQDLFQQAYNAGARIHSNSWGSDAAGDYTLDSTNTDTFIWNNPDMTITFSAGNAGVDTNANGVVDNDSIGSPATAKNVITVGASENDRQGDYGCDTNLTYISSDSYQIGETCTSMGGNNILGTAGERWGFTAEPLNSDPSAGNSEQMAPFSSRGPTDDGRIKPDVVAPGSWVLSGYSSLYQEGYADPFNPINRVFQLDGWGIPHDETHKYFGGTSMSNPLTAGAAAVVRDFYQKAYSHAASAALVKATLINSAVDMLDENNDGANDNDFAIPNVHEGWGRVNLANATDGSHEFEDQIDGLVTGATNTFQYNLASGGGPFKVSLVWSDFPSTETAAQNLVNDLDLVVTAPGGSTYRGNVFSNGWSQTGGSADRINNVENVYVQSAGAGMWNVEVTGFNVPNGPQPFALVVDGSSGTGDSSPTINSISPAEGSTISGNVTVQIDATDAEDTDGSLTVEWNIDSGGWQSVNYNSSSGFYEANWDTTTAGDGPHTINVRATDSTNNVSTDSNNVTVDNPVAGAPTINSVSPAEGSTISGNVTVQIDATDAEDAAGNLTVEWNIDGGAWQPANYNSSTGLYEANWDTSTTGDGPHAINVRAIDSANNTTTGSNNVTVDSPPTINSISPAEGSTVSGSVTVQVDATDALDASGSLTVEWNIDGGAWQPANYNSSTGLYEANWDTSTTGDGPHTINVRATDSANNVFTDSNNVTVDNSPPNGILHVGDLDGISARGNQQWTTTVTIVVHDADHNPVTDATISGTWSGGFSGIASCSTDGNGQCSVTSGSAGREGGSSMTFTVDDVSHATLTYQPADNHDPDGDSNGTSITVLRP